MSPLKLRYFPRQVLFCFLYPSKKPILPISFFFVLFLFFIWEWLSSSHHHHHLFLSLCVCLSVRLTPSNFFNLPRQKGSLFMLVRALSLLLYSNALSLTQSFCVYDVFMCLSIAKQYFVHTAEPLCVSVDDEDGDPTVCVFSFLSLSLSLVSTHQSFFLFPSISRQGYRNSFSSFSLCLCLFVYVRVCVPSTIITIIISRRTTTRVTSSLFFFLCFWFSLSVLSFDALEARLELVLVLLFLPSSPDRLITVKKSVWH